MELNYTALAEQIADHLQTTRESSALLSALPEPWDDAPVVAPTSKPCSIFDDDYYDNPPETNLGQWLEQRTVLARAKYQPWDEIVLKIEADTFRTHAQLEAFYKKHQPWANKLRDLAVSQGVFATQADWKSHFAGRLLHQRQGKTPVAV